MVMSDADSNIVGLIPKASPTIPNIASMKSSLTFGLHDMSLQATAIVSFV